MADEAEAATRGRVRVERGHKRVRVFLEGRLVADTLNPRLVWEVPYYPAYYFPAEDVRAELTATGATEHSPSRGDATVYDVSVTSAQAKAQASAQATANAQAKAAARRYLDSPIEELRGLVRLDWDAMSAWFEEDEPVYTHPRDPYTRVDILASSRHVRIEVDGVTVADSVRPHILFETGLPARYYLPLTDVRMGLLRPSAALSHCPYKGTATYQTLDTGRGIHEDLVWMYRAPLPESQKIAGLVCFYNEKVDIYIDDVLQPQPRTKFS